MKKRGKEKGIHIHFTNRWLYTLIVGIITIMGVGVFACANSLLTPGTAPNPGHTISQASPPSSCSVGQVLQWNGTSNPDGGWTCVNLPTSSNPAPVSTGLYGQCYTNANRCDDSTTYRPAICVSGNYCSCTAGYTSVITGYAGPTSGWKVSSCMKN